MNHMDNVAAVDLGGTKLCASVVDGGGSISFRVKRPVEAASVSSTVEQIAGVVVAAADQARAAGKALHAVGLIVPGIYFEATGNVWAPNLWGHEQVPLGRELERAVPLPVVIASDRAGYVTGERWLGAAKGANDVVFLSIGTGIGAGIISGGRLLRGAGDIAGAVGWFALNPEIKPIYGQVGCFEAEAAGPGLARRMNAHTAQDVIAAARQGDASAREAIEQTGSYLGMGLANIVSLLNPEVVVLGGGVMQAGDLFLEPVTRVMKQWAQPVAAEQVRVTLTQLGEDAGLLGAGKLALESLTVE